MKYMILVFLLVSCSLSYDMNPCVGMSEEQTLTWVKNNISYSWDDLEYWQSPKETLEKLSGDCEDYVILFMYLVYQNTGKKYDMGVVKSGKYFHAVCVAENKVINVQGNSTYTMDDIIIRNGYNLVMAIASPFGVKND